MRLLLTGANSALGRGLVSTLSQTHRIRAVDTTLPKHPQGADWLAGDLRDLEFAAAAVAEVDVVLHLAPLYTRFADEGASLDHATRGTYQLATAAAAAQVERIILAGSLDLFEPLWSRYRVDEAWRPRPLPRLDPLCAYLAEVALREVVRESQTPACSLRLGHVVDDEFAGSHPYDPRWLHVEDAVAALTRALSVPLDSWQIWHIGAAGERTAVPVTRAAAAPFNYQPQHDFRKRWSTGEALASAPAPDPMPTRPIRRVTVFGAGGPLGAAVAQKLASSYTLTLTDVAPLEKLMAAEPQSPGAPLPEPIEAPHSWQIVDVRDPEQVRAAAAEADAIVNLSVVRHDPADAFRVNALGAYNVMQAAVAHEIKRVVHTGPFMLGQPGPTGYSWDQWIVDDVPPRPGIGWVYIPSKLLGQEICRIFAEYYALEVPTLTFAAFLNPAVQHGPYLSPLSVSWQDAARAVGAALSVESLPTPYEFFHIGADLPHGVFPNAKAKRLLDWSPQDNFESYYLRT